MTNGQKIQIIKSDETPRDVKLKLPKTLTEWEKMNQPIKVIPS